MILVTKKNVSVEPWKKWRKNTHFDHVKNVYTGVKICDRLHGPTGVYTVNERDDSTLMRSALKWRNYVAIHTSTKRWTNQGLTMD